jgi:hypothetical protein
MAEQQNVDFLITARDQATRVLQGIGSSFDNITRSYRSLQTLVGGTGVFAAMQKIAEATIEQERAQARLNATLQATGHAAGITRGELNQIADDLKGRTVFDDDAIRRGLASMLRFRSIQGDVFREAAGLAADLAAALDTDLNSAFQRLGRALEDPEKGLRALREAGINVTSATERVKKVMEETGDVAKAQKIILEELGKSVGGAAAGENAGLYGSVKALDKAWDDFLKGLGQREQELGRLRRTFGLLQSGLELLTPARATAGPTGLERDEAERGRREAESARLQEAAQKQIDEDIKKIQEESAARTKRLQEEDVKGWIAHAEAVIAENFREAEALAKISIDFWAQKDREREEDLRREQQYRDRIAARVIELQLANVTELEQLQLHMQDKQLLLEDARELDLISQEEFERQSALIVQQYEEQKTRIADEEIRKRYGIAQVYRQLDLVAAQFTFSQLAQMMQSGSKTMFNVGKQAAIAETIIQTYRGAQGAFAALASIPIVGPALGAAAAAAAIVAGLARVQQIRNTQFGAAGATPVFSANPVTGAPTEPIGTAGPIPPPALSAPAAPRSVVNVTFVGTENKNIDYQTMVEDFVPLLNDAIANGAEINLTLA